MTADPRLRAELGRWLRAARSTGLGRDDVTALFTAAVRHCYSEGVA